MSDRDGLLKNFLDAAHALMGEGLSSLSPEKAVLVEAAQRAGADICMVYAPGAHTIVGALHPVDPAHDPLTLFQINLAPLGTSN